MLQTRTSTTRV